MDAHHLIQLEPNKKIPEFRPGDTVRVNFRIREGERERIQAFQGVVIRRHGGGPGSSFTVRQVAHGIGVERIFPLYSPLVESLVVLRHGKVRRARLYYLRGRFGRAARIKERAMRPTSAVDILAEEEVLSEEEVLTEEEAVVEEEAPAQEEAVVEEEAVAEEEVPAEVEDTVEEEASVPAEASAPAEAPTEEEVSAEVETVNEAKASLEEEPSEGQETTERPPS